MKTKGKRISAIIAALAVFAIVGTGIAGAHQSPASCSTVGLGISIGEGPSLYHVGDIINYMIRVSLIRSSDCDVSNINLTITKPDGTLATVTGINLNQSQNTTDIGPFPYTIKQGDKILTAKAVAVSADAHSVIMHQNVSPSAEISAMVIYPAITVLKTCTPATQLAPGTITWTVTVNNTGDTPLKTNVTDSMHGVILSGTLEPGASNVTIVTNTGFAAGTYTNTVTATGKDILGKEVSAIASATCTVTAPGKPGKVVGWGLIGNRASPDMEFQLFAYYRFSKHPVYIKDSKNGLIIEEIKVDSILTDKSDKITRPLKGWISGRATVNGEGNYPFTIYVEDNADPSEGKDVFQISLPTYGPSGYSGGGKPGMGDINVIK